VVPSGYKEYRDDLFAAAVPAAWTQDTEDAPDDIVFQDPGANTRRGISLQKVSGTTGNEAAHLAQAEQSMRTEYENYRRLSFDDSLPYLGRTAAQFEFSFTRDGVGGRARTRLISFRGSLYIIVMVARADLWSQSTPMFDTFLRTFRQS
ncbi:hypothetical protein ACFQ07_14660, partial [Actinomadura adrarensis]